MHRFLRKISFVTLALIAGIFFSSIQDVKAATQPLTGYAWSSNIGWISFNCTNKGSCASNGNYGVVMEMDQPTTKGNLSGWAWSSNVGWVSFNQTSGCPGGGTCAPKVNLNDGEVTGWARVCSATINKDCNSPVYYKTSYLNSSPVQLVLNNQTGFYDGKISINNPTSESVNISSGARLYVKSPLLSQNSLTNYRTGADGTEVIGGISYPYILVPAQTLSPGQTVILPNTISWYDSERILSNITNLYSGELSGTVADWDGWIKLSGTNHTSPVSNGTQGVTYNKTTGYFNGHAWGDEIVGWVKFNVGSSGVKVTPEVNTPTCTNFQATPGETNMNLSWQITNDPGTTPYVLKRGTAVLKSDIGSGSGSYNDLGLTPGVEYSYTLSRAGSNTCSQTRMIPPGGGAEEGKLWLGSSENTIRMNMDVDDYVNVNWRIPDGAVCSTTLVRPTGGTIPAWNPKPNINSPGTQKVENITVEGIYTLGLSCTKNSASVPVNTVKLIISRDNIEEI